MREKDFEFVIAEWKSRELPSLIDRETEIPKQSSSIVCVAGGRQVGKTYRIFQLIKELKESGFPEDNILYVNFEHERLTNLNARDLEEMLKVFYKLSKVKESEPVYLFLDEIQNVKNWDKWVRRIFDSGKFRIYITGSSSKVLGEKIPKSLRGRSIDFVIFPFSFTEFLKAKGDKFEKFEVLTEKRGKLLKELEEFLTLGSYPKVTMTEEKEKTKVLLSYYRTIFYKDLVENYGIENTSALDAFLKYSINNFAKYVSVSKAYNYIKSLGIKCGKETLINFLRFSNEIFFLFPLEILSPSIKARALYPKKIYLIDNGIATTIFPEVKQSVGRLMENVVARELLKIHYSTPSLEVFYWKEYGRQEGKEVDFIVKEGLKVKQLIQVTYASSKDEIEQREIKALLKASDLLKCKDLLVITWDYDDEEKINSKKIRFVPLWKWLLSKET